MKKLHIPDAIKNGIFVHASTDYPNECCGAMFGTESVEKRTVKQLLPIVNTHEDNHQRRFRITPTEYLSAERRADELGLSLLGFYHSHPDHPAIPSGYDLQYSFPFFS